MVGLGLRRMETETKRIIKPFDEATNFRLRDLYLQSLGAIVKYPDQQPRPRVRRHEAWRALPPFGRNGWGATKGVFANHTHPKDIVTAQFYGANVWVWSDLHFGHKNIIRFSDRPFPDIPTMDEALIRSFNELVQPNDISIWVGDVAFSSDERANSLLHRCAGYKILVIGNHDFAKSKLKKLHFDEIHIVYNLVIDGITVAFTHYPMDNLPEGWINIHGHVHKGKPDKAATNRHINVNCEFIDYKPVNLTELADQVTALASMPEGGTKMAYDEYD
jgi:calcineurin-like phosphoesterase family protein